MKKIVLALIFVLTIGPVCYGARPLSVEDAGTVARGEFEIETGSAVTESRNGDYESVLYGQVRQGFLMIWISAPHSPILQRSLATIVRRRGSETPQWR